jgi:hypothetical protein
MTFKDNIDLQIGTYPNALRTLRRASWIASIVGFIMIAGIVQSFLQHKLVISTSYILGPYLMIYFGAIARRTGKELKLREEQKVKNAQTTN